MLEQDFNIFVETLQIGERLFDLNFTDYWDAYDFSKKNYSEVSDHFIDYFDNHSNLSREQYEDDLIRYIFIKAVEQRISSALFADTSRGNVCDVFQSPFDIAYEQYPTNLPKHLEDLVNQHQDDGQDLADAILHAEEEEKEYILSSAMLNAIQFLGHTVGYPIGKDNHEYKEYDCSEMLTRNEMNEEAGYNFCNWLKRNGYEIENANFTRDSIQNVVATCDGQRFYILLAVEIAPVDPGFIPNDLEQVYQVAHEENAIPCYASISLASTDSQHFNDGVILYGDGIRYRVNAFGPLEKEEQ